jgi:hypothetical protein
VRQQNEQTVQAKHADGRLVITKSVTYSLFTNCNDKIPNSIARARTCKIPNATARARNTQFAEQFAEPLNTPLKVPLNSSLNTPLNRPLKVPLN